MTISPWTHVNDGLPEEMQVVLASTGEDDRIPWPAYWRLPKGAEKPSWRWVLGGHAEGAVAKIQWWMPIPIAPPREEQKDGG